MKRISIEGTDLTFCPIGLGAAVAGLTWDGAEADRIFDAYLDMGGNLVDYLTLGAESVRCKRPINY